jgi:hypothetical protein
MQFFVVSNAVFGLLLFKRVSHPRFVLVSPLNIATNVLLALGDILANRQCKVILIVVLSALNGGLNQLRSA